MQMPLVMLLCAVVRFGSGRVEELHSVKIRKLDFRVPNMEEHPGQGSNSKETVVGS